MNAKKRKAKITWNDIMRLLINRAIKGGLTTKEIQEQTGVSRELIQETIDGSRKNGRPNEKIHDRLISYLQPSQHLAEMANQAYNRSFILIDDIDWQEIKSSFSICYPELSFSAEKTEEKADNNEPKESQPKKTTESLPGPDIPENIKKISHFIEGISQEHPRLREEIDPERINLFIKGYVIPEKGEIEILKSICQNDINPIILDEMIHLALFSQFQMFPDLLKFHRESKDWTQKKLAKASKIKYPAAISALETDPNSRKNKIETDIKNIAKALNLTPERKSQLISAGLARIRLDSEKPDEKENFSPKTHASESESNKEQAINLAISVYLEKIRNLKNITLEDLSRKTTLDKERLIEIDRKGQINLQELAEIAKALNLNTEEKTVLSGLFSVSSTPVSVKIESKSPPPWMIFNLLDML